jgi:hypothetical protein
LTAPLKPDINFLDCREKARRLDAGRAVEHWPGRKAPSGKVISLGGLHEIDYPSVGRIGHCAHHVDSGFAKDMVIGVSWSNFQEERWED